MGTVVLWVLFVWLEASVRLREMKTIDLCRPFAAHCIGYPMVTLGFGFKTYLAYKWRLRKQREVRKINESYIELINQALPMEIQQEAEKEKILREKGSFVESYEECSNSDGLSPSTTNMTTTTTTNSISSSSSSSPPFSLINSALLNSQTQFNSLPCTASKRSQKLNNNPEDFSTSNSLVQTTARTKISNGNDEDSSSYKQQQKKQLVKSSNISSRRQQRKQDTKEITRPTSRDSSTSYQNGSDNIDMDKSLQISKLESDVQRLNQSVEKQKTTELQLRTQLSDMKMIRKEIDDLRAENSGLQTK